MSKQAILSVFNPLNELLPKELQLNKFVKKIESYKKSFILEIKVDLSSYQKNDYTHGIPAGIAHECNDELGISQAGQQFLEVNQEQIFSQEFEKYQKSKEKLYLPEENTFNVQTYYYKVKCITCHASGNIKCQECAATGYVQCGNCHGSGIFRKHNKKTQQNSTMTCVYCNNGKSQCTTCLSLGRVKCSDCNGICFNSTINHVIFHSRVSHLYTFDLADENTSFARTIRGMTLSKLANCCSFEQLTAKFDGKSILLSYKVYTPVDKIILQINDKTHSINVLTENREFCDSITIFDDLLCKTISYCNQYIRSGSLKTTPDLYKKLKQIPFIKKAIIEISKTAGEDAIIAKLKINSNGFISDKYLPIIASSIIKSLQFVPKTRFVAISIICTLPNLFIGILLAFISNSKESFITQLGIAEIILFVTTLLPSILIGYAWHKINYNKLPKQLFDISNNVVNNSFNIGIILSLIGVLSSSYQHDFAIKKFKLHDNFTTNTLPSNTLSQHTASKPKSNKKSKKNKSQTAVPH